MKKLFSVVLVLVMFLGVVTVKAMTEDELYDALTQTIKINGVNVSVSETTKNHIKTYLNQFDVSSEDCEFINTRINTAISILKSEGKTDFSKLSSSAKSQLKALVQEINSGTAVKATVTNGSVVVYDNNGGEFFTVTDLVKQTGSGASTTAIIATISLVIVAAGALLVGRQVKHSN